VRLRGQRTEWAALAPQLGKQRQWQQQQRPWSGPTLLEESECDGGDEQEECLDWGEVGRLMSKDVDQLQQSRECWSAEAHFTRTDQHPWKADGDSSHGIYLTHPPPRVRSLTTMTSRILAAPVRRPTCRVRSRAEAWGMVLYIRPSISHSCGTMGAKSSSSVLTDFSKIAHTALGRKQRNSVPADHNQWSELKPFMKGA
jgi:hypothetical protein